MTLSTTTTGDVISSDKVEGTSVYNTAGDELGSIDDLMIDKHTGQVRYAVMKFGGRSSAREPSSKADGRPLSQARARHR